MSNKILNFKNIKNFKLILIIATAIILVAFLFLILNSIFWTKASRDIRITISSGEGTQEISQNLKNEKVINSSWIFSAFVYGRRWYLQTGIYHIKPEMNMVDIATMIHEGRVEEYLVTIPEGWRVTQIDAELAAKGIIKAGEFTQIASENEGYLFPDTYRLPLNATAEQIKNLMLDNFKRKTADLKIMPQTIILASIVERESRLDADRPKVAGVYLRRLELGMRLEADPTIQYGKGDWSPITAADYKNFQHPYNTYLNNGLPPGPICNPGLKSIEAVLYPQKDGFLYFFHTSDGRTIFSQTYEEHLEKLKNP